MTQPNPKIATRWRNKVSGAIVKVAPWWEIVEPVVELGDKEAEKALNLDQPRRAKFGSLVQVGWLIMNQHNVYFGVSLETKDQFEEVIDE